MELIKLWSKLIEVIVTMAVMLERGERGWREIGRDTYRCRWNQCWSRNAETIKEAAILPMLSK